MTVKDRLLKFMEHVDMSQGRFEKHVGLSNGYVNNIGRGINSAQLNKISEKFPELNTNWLLNGEGEMLKPEFGRVEPGNEMNLALALELAILDDYLDWKSKETGVDYRALKANVFGKAKLILRNLDVVSLKAQFDGQPQD